METDTLEAAVFNGNVTILDSNNTDYGNGSLEVQGTIYTDTIRTNTSNGTIDLENIEIKDGVFTLPTQLVSPSAPVTGKYTFYINSDGKLVSLDNSSNITLYQPLTTKGDLLGYSTIQDRLPVGPDNSVLIADSTQATGLKWVTTLTSLSAKSKLIFIGGNTVLFSELIIDSAYGSHYANCFPCTFKGSAGNLIISKAFLDSVPNAVRLAASPSSNGVGNVLLHSTAYNGMSIYKNNSEGDGNYKINDSSDLVVTYQITLSGVSPVQINTVTTGSFFISVSCSEPGPAAVFMCCKSNSSLNTGTITRVSSSPGNNNCNLLITWPATSGLFLNKTTISDHPGVYNVIDNFQNSGSEVDITLTGTASTTIPDSIFPYYDKKSFFVKVVGSTPGMPNAIFACSKNRYNTNGTFTLFRSPGAVTSELLSLRWNSSEKLKISKSNTNHNGIYRLVFTKLS